MKKTILLSSILAAGALFAELISTEVASTEVGVMGLAAPSEKSTLLAIPFLGYTANPITVADMVNTAQLAKDSNLYVPNTDGTYYDVWTLNEDKQWEKTNSNVVIDASGAASGEGPEVTDVTTTRGGAFWLEPAANSESLVYLLGKPASDAGTSMAVAKKWNLIGNASLKEVTTLGNAVVQRDQVAIQIEGKLRYYMYMGENNGWCYQNDNGTWAKNQKLPVALGQGLWFKPASTVTIDWENGTIAPVDVK